MWKGRPGRGGRRFVTSRAKVAETESQIVAGNDLERSQRACDVAGWCSDEAREKRARTNLRLSEARAAEHERVLEPFEEQGACDRPTRVAEALALELVLHQRAQPRSLDAEPAAQRHEVTLGLFKHA